MLNIANAFLVLVGYQLSLEDSFLEQGFWDSLLPWGLSCPFCPTRSTRLRLFLLLLRSHVAVSLSFSHSQTTPVLIKPRGLTFSPRYLECCTKSIVRPCQAGNKPRLFPFWDFSTLVLLAVRNKLKLGFPAAQHSSYSCAFVSGEIIFRDIIPKVLLHNFSMFYIGLKCG